MKISNKSKFISVLIGAAMCPMVLPTAAFAAGAGVASGVSSSPAELTQPEGTESAIAEVNGKSYPSLQEAINAAPRKATVKLLADTKENVTISTPYVTLDLNGHTLNGSTGERKPALTVTDHVTVMDSSETKTGTIARGYCGELRRQLPLCHRHSGKRLAHLRERQRHQRQWRWWNEGRVPGARGR